MSTPPDGTPPTMQMYLQHQPGTSYPDGDPFPANNTGDEAVTVYHEYTHGLSNRLVVDVLGNSTLGPVQADAMGEAWGDWYAADSLVSDGLEVDKKGKADLDAVPVRRRRRVAHPHPGHRLHADVARVPLPRWRDRPRGRLHLRRLRQGLRRPRGARRRRDLGPDPLVAARQGRLPGVAEPGDPGHGAGAVQPVVPRHAQRAAGRGHGPLQGQVPHQDLEHVRQPRHGLLRRLARRQRRPARPPTRTDPPKTVADRPADRHGEGQRHRSPGSPASRSRSPSRARAWPTRPRSPTPTATTPSARCPRASYGKLTVNGAGYVPISTATSPWPRAARRPTSGHPRLGRRERWRHGGRPSTDPTTPTSAAGPVQALDTLAGDRVGQHHRQQQGHARPTCSCPSSSRWT